MKVHIRWLIKRDIPEVLEIEEKSFPYAWTEDDLLSCLRPYHNIGLVAEYRTKVVGFIIFKLNKSNINLLNLAVHPEFRRLGVGTQLVTKMLDKLSIERRCRLIVDIDERNLDGQLFLAEQGFLATKMLSGRCPNGDDAYRMVFSVGEAITATTGESYAAR